MNKPPATTGSGIVLFGGAAVLRWFGTNCLYIKTPDASLMVDPHFSRPGIQNLVHKISPKPQYIRRALEQAGVKNLDAILITHSHYDHVMDASDTAWLTQAVLYGSESVMQTIPGSQIPSNQFQQVQPGFEFLIGGIKARFFESAHVKFPGKLADWVHLNEKMDHAIHPPVWFWQYRAGTVYSILLELDGHSLYIQGSAGVVGQNPTIPSADAAVLSIAGLQFKSRQYRQAWFSQTVLRTGAREVFFSHWDNFFLPWNSTPHHLPGIPYVIRHLSAMCSACPGIQFRRLTPG